MTTTADRGGMRPLIVALAALLFYIGWFVLPPLLAGQEPGTDGEPDGMEQMSAAFTTEVWLVLSVLAICLVIRDWRGLRITTPLEPRWFLWLLPPILYLLLFVGIGQVQLRQTDISMSALLAGPFRTVLITTFLVGIFEEFLFRGIVFRGFEKVRGPVVAFVVSSVLFGAMHYVNWIGGQSLGTTHIQVLHAGAAGLLYAGLMLKTGTIWVPVLYHGLWDCIVSVNQTIAMIAAPEMTEEMAAAIADPGIGVHVFQGAIYGFEPVYGLILFYAWYRSRRGA